MDPNATVDDISLDDFEKEFFQRGSPKEQEIDSGTVDPATEEAEPSEENNETAENETETDTEQDQDQDQDEEQEEPEKDEKEDKLRLKPKKKAQDRIDELTRKVRESERREADLAKKLEELAKPKEEVVQPPVDKGPPSPDDVDDKGEPKYPLGEFDPAFARDNISYATAQAREAIRQEAEAEKAAAAKQAEEAEQQKAIENLQGEWEEKLQKASETIPDVRTKGAALEPIFGSLDPSYGEYIAATLMSLDHGPEVLYYLAENIDEAMEIVSSGPVKATIALGILEAQMAGVKKKEVKVTNAKEPPKITARGHGGMFSVRGDTEDLDAFEKEFFKK